MSKRSGDRLLEWFERLPLPHIWLCTIGICLTFWYFLLAVVLPMAKKEDFE